MIFYFLSLNPTEEDNRLFILILVASFIIISMIIIIGSTACILLCFEESIEEKEEELQEKLLKFTEVRKIVMVFLIIFTLETRRYVCYLHKINVHQCQAQIEI